MAKGAAFGPWPGKGGGGGAGGGSSLAKFSGTVLTNAEAPTFSYLSDIGTEQVVPTSNQTDPLLYPSGARTITALIGCAPVGTGAQPPTFTIYKNGVATTMTVTLPASTGGRVVEITRLNPVTLVDGDSYDVRCDFAATAEGNQPVSAQIESVSAGTADLTSVGLPGPTALGTAGVAATSARGDTTAAAYRSDLPLATTWFIDPVSGDDAPTNGGTTNATALRTLQQLAQRWWGAVIGSNTTITILGDIPNTDVPAWNFTCQKGVTVTIIGSLGPTTGFGGRAIDNTLYSGTLTGVQNTPVAASTNDTEIADTGIPVSYTASGLLAAGVMFQTTSGTTTQFWALEDLGSKTLRTNPPLNNVTSTNLVVGQNYSAYHLWSIFDMRFPQEVVVNVLVQNLFDQGTTTQQFTGLATRRRNVWVSGRNFLQIVNSAINCAWFGGGAGGSISSFARSQVTIYGGAWFGNWSSTDGAFLVAAPWAFQGGAWIISDTGWMTIEAVGGIYDSTVGLQAIGHGSIAIGSATFPAGGGISGAGNTGKLLVLSNGGRFVFQNPILAAPFVAGSSSDPSPVEIGSSSYTVGNVPFTTVNQLCGSVTFPFGPVAGPANGAVAVTINNAPTGTAAAPVRYVDFPDGAGGVWRFPSLA